MSWAEMGLLKLVLNNCRQEISMQEIQCDLQIIWEQEKNSQNTWDKWLIVIRMWVPDHA